MRAFITGGSKGIGLAIKNKFCENGWDVICPSSKELNLAFTTFKSDIKKYKESKIDVIINNAGINRLSSLEDIDTRDLDEMIKVNVTSPLLICQNLIDHMKTNKYGRIVNISSIFGTITKKNRLMYSTTKSAIQGMTRSLAIELAPHNILVNSVSPGYVGTDMTYKNNSDEEIKNLEKSIPLGRMASPSEMTELVYFLSSGNNTYLTGQNIIMDGGFSIC